MKPIVMYIDDELKKALEARAKEWHVGISTAIRLIVAKELRGENVLRKIE